MRGAKALFGKQEKKAKLIHNTRGYKIKKTKKLGLRKPRKTKAGMLIGGMPIGGYYRYKEREDNPTYLKDPIYILREAIKALMNAGYTRAQALEIFKKEELKPKHTTLKNIKKTYEKTKKTRGRPKKTPPKEPQSTKKTGKPKKPRKKIGRRNVWIKYVMAHENQWKDYKGNRKDYIHDLAEQRKKELGLI